MKHVPIAEFKDKLSGYVAAAEAGDEITITRHGRVVAKLIAPDGDDAVRRKQVLAEMATSREAMRARGMQVSRDDILAWIREGRQRDHDRP